MIPVCRKAKGITRNMVMPRPDLPYYMLNTLTKAKIPYDGPCAGALADESPKSKIIQKCQNVN